jgi:hypothetical protein
MHSTITPFRTMASPLVFLSPNQWHKTDHAIRSLRNLISVLLGDFFGGVS